MLYGIGGSSKSNVCAVGVYSIILHYNGKIWEESVQITNKRLDDIILHYDEVKWTSRLSNTNNWLRKICGIDNNNIFAIGDNGIIIHGDYKRFDTKK